MESTDKAFCFMKRFILLCYLFDLGFVLKFQFSFVIYIYILFFSRLLSKATYKLGE